MKLLILALTLCFNLLAQTNDNAEIMRKIDILADEIASLKASQLNISTGQTAYGLGQAASKVYFLKEGLSIGGYGEIVYNNQDSRDEDDEQVNSDPTTEALRNVIYIGYKYNDKWIINTEIEIEHVNEVYTEFMYVDYLASSELNYRFGLSLIPMGLTNELHEPIYFNSVNRPEIEKYLIPTTWREIGVGVFGTKGKLDYKAFIFNGPNGDKIAQKPSNGIRSGRKKGGSSGEDNASTHVIVLNANYNLSPSSFIGGSILNGEASSDRSENLKMSILEIHGQMKKKNIGVKFLGTQVDLTNADDYNKVSADRVVKTMNGYYIELEYDIKSAGAVYTPFIRYSDYDLAANFDKDDFAEDKSLKRNNTVIGLAFKPIDRLVFKADYAIKKNDANTGISEFNLGLGFVF